MIGTTLVLSALAGLVQGLGSTDTITWGGDNSRAGYQTNHNMDPAIVGSAQFGELFSTQLPGVYVGEEEEFFSQPLVYTPSSGDKQFVYIASTQNNVYKLDAKTGAIVASRNLHIPFLSEDLDGCVDINPTIGVTSTGVIDPDTDTLYLTSKTYLDQTAGEVAQGRPAGRYYVHAISTDDLSERANFPVDLEGILAKNNPTRMFTGGIHHQRPGLLHTGQYIYAGFASHCVQYNFTGWIIGWDKTTGNIVEHFATEGQGVPNDVKGAGVWMSGGGLSSDDRGSIWFASGNGYASQLADIPVKGFDPPTSLEEAAVHMTINDDGSLNLVDFFMPWEKRALDGGDQDLGTSPLEILPSEFSCGNYNRIGVVTGKSGKTYFLNLDNLGGYRNGDDGLDDVIQVYKNENSVYAGAGVYPLEGGYIYINVIQHPTHVFKFSCDNGTPSFTKVADSPNDNAYILGVSHGTVTSLDGQEGTGLLWVTDREGYNLRIYDAVPKDGLLTMINSFNVPNVIKFTRPVFGDGIMYMGTSDGKIHGFGSPVNAPLNCTSPVEFGTVDVAQSSETKEITCTALIGVTVQGIALGQSVNFALSDQPTLPQTLTKGQTFTVTAKFAPKSVGLLSDDVVFNTTNSVDGFSTSTHSRLTGTGESSAPLLGLNPSTLTFSGIVAGQDPNGVTESVFLSNLGNSELTLNSVSYSTTGNGAFTAWDFSGDLTVGQFTIKNLEKTIAAQTDDSLEITFDSSKNGTFAAFVKFESDGGDKSLAIAGSAGSAPVALLEFQTPDGKDWVEYKSGVPFSFGNVTENNARSLQFRITNAAPVGGVKLYLTVSKPPFAVKGLVRSVNAVDLAEGTSIGPGESASAILTCTVPKEQWNTDPYESTSVWTINNNDPNFEKAVLEFFCRAVSEQAPPLLDNGLGQYRYIGCYKENNPNRQLQSQLFGDDDLVNAECITACDKGNWVFCGTQYHRECWAGNTIPKEQVADENCNYYCAGDLNQYCGGNGAADAGGAYISLFADALQWDGNYTRPDDGSGGGDDGNNGGGGNGGDGGSSQPVVNPGVNGYVSIGCYTEATHDRALPKGVNLDTPTVANCVKACSASGYIYAGLEYAGECWCGNKFSDGAIPALAADCSLACKGNTTELCGGNSRLNVYKAQSANTTEPANPVPGTKTNTATTTSTPKPTSTGPAVKDSVNGWTFQGCWTEADTGRALASETYAKDDMTLESCAEFCDGYTYFGTEYGRECYCGDELRTGSVKATKQSDCSFPCAGDKSEYCGAGLRLQLYKAGDESAAASPTAKLTTTDLATSVSPAALTSSTTTPIEEAANASTSTTAATSTTPSTTPSPTPSTTTSTTPSTTPTSSAAQTTTSSAKPTTPTSSTSKTSTSKTSSSAAAKPTGPFIYPGNTNFTYYSCVSEPSSGRMLKSQVLNDGKAMTIQRCLESCWMYDWAGVEYGRECWCGNTLNLAGNKGATPGKNVTESECKFTCPGNSTSLCGAGLRMNLYSNLDREP